MRSVHRRSSVSGKLPEGSGSLDLQSQTTSARRRAIHHLGESQAMSIPNRLRMHGISSLSNLIKSKAIPVTWGNGSF